MLREASTAMAKLSWGSALSDVTRAAVCRWALENDVDPLRHFDILGNNIYPNARYYYDKVASEGNLHHDEVVIIAPLVSIDFSKMPVSPAQRDELKAQAQEINAERLMLQMAYGVPEAINASGQHAAAAVVRLFWNDGSMSEGCNWAGKYGQKKGDPVGEEHPVKTAITRAFRKAAMKKVSVHKFAKGEEGTPVATLGTYIDQDREERHAAKPHRFAIAPGNFEDPYGLNKKRETEDAEAPVSEPETDEAPDQDAEVLQEDMSLDDD